MVTKALTDSVEETVHLEFTGLLRLDVLQDERLEEFSVTLALGSDGLPRQLDSPCQ